MGMPWFRFNVDAAGHPKLARLEALLGVPDALGIVVRLWTWTARYAPLGTFPIGQAEAMTTYVTRDATGGEGLLNSLASSGFVERDSLQIIVHDWRDYQGAWINLTEKNRKRQQRHRAKVKSELSRVTVTPPSRPTVRNGTVQEEDLKALSTSLTTAPPNGVEQVFEHWKRVMRKPRAKLDDKRRKLIKARLLEGRTPEEICRAIEGYSRDDFSMGKNDRLTPYNDIALICRDAAHVEKFMPAIQIAQAPALKRKTEAEIAAEVRRELEAKRA